MNAIQKLIKKIDNLQQRHRFTAFVYAVIKKYGDDQAGYQAALLTYYGFLSLFPLLLVLTTVTALLGKSYPSLQQAITTGVTDYFPVLGNQLSEHVHTLHKTGLALAIGILFTLYGARGVADAFRHGVNHIWQVPLAERDGFPKSLLKSLGIILVGGAGLIFASVSAGWAIHAGHGWGFRSLSIAINLFVLFWLFVFLLDMCLPSHVKVRRIRAGAATAAVGLVILQALGGYLLSKQLQSLDALYSSFAIALGLLFWIYLQAQVMYYAVEVAAVKAHKLWPRSFSDPMTDKDKKNYRRQAAKERVRDDEHVTADFDS